MSKLTSNNNKAFGPSNQKLTSPSLVYYYGGANSNVSIWFTPQSTITEGAYSNRTITSPSIKANNKMVILIGAPSSLEDGCIWIER